MVASRGHYCPPRFSILSLLYVPSCMQIFLFRARVFIFLSPDPSLLGDPFRLVVFFCSEFGVSSKTHPCYGLDQGLRSLRAHPPPEERSASAGRREFIQGRVPFPSLPFRLHGASYFFFLSGCISQTPTFLPIVGIFFFCQASDVLFI